MVAMVIKTMISVFPANICNCVFCLSCWWRPGSYWVSTDVYVLTLCMCTIDLPIVPIDSSTEWTSHEVFDIIDLGIGKVKKRVWGYIDQFSCNEGTKIGVNIPSIWWDDCSLTTESAEDVEECDLLDSFLLLSSSSTSMFSSTRLSRSSSLRCFLFFCTLSHFE